MNSIASSLIVFTCVFAGALLGMLLRTRLPEQHLGDASKDLVKQGMGLIGTMAALLLGLLVASAKSSYDTQKSEITDLSAEVVVLDHLMAHYGPDAGEVRGLLRGAVSHALDRIWPQDHSRSSQMEPTRAGAEVLYVKLQELSPKNDLQRSLQAQMLGSIVELGRKRWLMFEQGGSSISLPLLVVVVSWLAFLFVGFGLCAPANATVITTLFLCALSVSGAIFLILEMDRPFDGIIEISSAPLRAALERLGQ